MTIMITETGEKKQLNYYGKNSTEDARDIIGNADELDYDDETDNYVMTQDSYGWWLNYFNMRVADEAKAEELIAEYGEEAKNIILDCVPYAADIGSEHDEYLKAFERIAALKK